MRLSFFCVNSAYCDFLRASDPCVPYTSDKKAKRPFVGILLTINNIEYYAPLTSPKPKHQKMKSQLDFLKINNGLWGAINFNNMIPIQPDCLVKMNPAMLPSDTHDDTAYKNLLANQLSWCNQYRNQIINQAAKLYTLITTGKARPELAVRCCNFALDEKLCRQWPNTLPARSPG
jgi:protein AbiQ